MNAFSVADELILKIHHPFLYAYKYVSRGRMGLSLLLCNGNNPNSDSWSDVFPEKFVSIFFA